jgi:hypothetical protein
MAPEDRIVMEMPADGMIPFGDDAEVVPDWVASRILTLLCTRDPALLSALIGEAYTGTTPRARRATQAPPGR